MLTESELQCLREALLRWFSSQQRDLPWRRTRDPYSIWVSEIMLQQTRVAAVIPFYERFMRRFPDYAALAEASEQDLLACWAGLGYYHRARNLQRAARLMAASDSFPSNFNEIRALPGIGDYTAAAVASIAFDLPHAVLDGNALRVLARVQNDSTDIGSGTGKAHFAKTAAALLDKGSPGTFNQAVMELGATVCLPKNPQCLVCPVGAWCAARAHGTQSDLPVKRKPQRSLREERTVYWIEHGEHVLLWRRPDQERLMAGFWELPEQAHLPGVVGLAKAGEFRHSITLNDYRFEIWTALPPDDLGPCRWISSSAFLEIPVSTISRKARRIMARFKTGETRDEAAASGK